MKRISRVSRGRRSFRVRYTKPEPIEGYVRAIKRTAGAMLLCLAVLPARAADAPSTYVPPAIAFANQALQCDAEVGALRAKVAELEAEVKKLTLPPKTP